MARELAPYFIRVNAICPTTVATPMTMHESMYRLFRPDLDDPSQEDAVPAFRRLNLLPAPWVDPIDISNAVVFLASDEGRTITGVTLPVDLGGALK
jgi:(+)-trans-carveol dehydrogenase